MQDPSTMMFGKGEGKKGAKGSKRNQKKRLASQKITVKTRITP